jgi:hypothetical protein
MSRDLAIVFVASVLATFNPSLLAAVTVMLLLPNPKRLMLGYLLGAYSTSIGAGLAIVFSLEGSGAVMTSNHAASPAEDLAIGVVALTISLVLASHSDAPLQRWRTRRKDAKNSQRPQRSSWQQRMLAKNSAVITFAVGAIVSFPGVSYLNALDHIAHLEPPTFSILLLILYFCLMQQVLLELPLLACVFAPERTQVAVVRFRAWLVGHGRAIAVVVLAVVGSLLVARGLAG